MLQSMPLGSVSLAVEARPGIVTDKTELLDFR